MSAKPLIERRSFPPRPASLTDLPFVADIKLAIELDKAMQYASVKRMEMLYPGQTFNLRLLKSTATRIGRPPLDIFDANYGTVKAYHAEVWREAYALEIHGKPMERSA